ncbi:hypothetical protein DYD21_01660 [Rhodohalobacter sp. SW132]|uniref:FliH/SctL family protein n=1 Tax=Rhodohalobacter sp. SW132 TaxID=2293433 RepID=UPI000E2454C8|nr:hypothetical protein [Rhodohalobacter sp. SW132]REL38682.1 hypothetical protein DYD21_01660 [Rhodohalobacter sp. SW132]
MSRRIINNNNISWDQKDQATLSYKMLFDERTPEEISGSEEQPDIEELLAENNRQWEERLRRARKDVYEAALQEGLEQGYKQAAEEIDFKVQRLDSTLKEAHGEWQERQKLLDPGVIDLAFELAESILEIPVENPEIRNSMEAELGPILQRIEETTKPVLWISESDREYINRLKEEYAPGTTIYIRTDKSFNPGEYKLESNRETVVHTFKTMLADLKKSLTLPTWKP